MKERVPSTGASAQRRPRMGDCSNVMRRYGGVVPVCTTQVHHTNQTRTVSPRNRASGQPMLRSILNCRLLQAIGRDWMNPPMWQPNSQRLPRRLKRNCLAIWSISVPRRTVLARAWDGRINTVMSRRRWRPWVRDSRTVGPVQRVRRIRRRRGYNCILGGLRRDRGTGQRELPSRSGRIPERRFARRSGLPVRSRVRLWSIQQRPGTESDRRAVAFERRQTWENRCPGIS